MIADPRREAFEKWHNSAYLGGLSPGSINTAWAAWQAALASPGAAQQPPDEQDSGFRLKPPPTTQHYRPSATVKLTNLELLQLCDFENLPDIEYQNFIVSRVELILSASQQQAQAANGALMEMAVKAMSDISPWLYKFILDNKQLPQVMALQLIRGRLKGRIRSLSPSASAALAAHDQQLVQPLVLASAALSSFIQHKKIYLLAEFESGARELLELNDKLDATLASFATKEQPR